MLGRLKQAATHITPGEALVKLVLVITIVVPAPIASLALAGFWFDYYKLNTFPWLTTIGIILGTLLAFTWVVQIVIFGHKEDNTKGGTI